MDLSQDFSTDRCCGLVGFVMSHDFVQPLSRRPELSSVILGTQGACVLVQRAGAASSFTWLLLI